MTGPLLVSYVALWILVIVQAVALFALYHHFGQLYLNSPEGRANQGPEVDSELEPAEVRDVAGSAVRLPATGSPTIVVFASTDCEVCGELRPDLETFARERSEVRTLVICGGDLEDVARWADGLSEVAEVVPDPGYRIATRYDVGITPFLVATDARGVVRTKGIVNELRGLEAVEEIVSEQRARERRLVQLEERS